MNNNFIDLLKEEEFHLDPLGRIVIDSPEILAAINGAMKQSADAMLFNGGCSNSGCK